MPKFQILQNFDRTVFKEKMNDRDMTQVNQINFLNYLENIDLLDVGDTKHVDEMYQTWNSKLLSITDNHTLLRTFTNKKGKSWRQKPVSLMLSLEKNN